MAFAQMTYRESLRDIEACLQARPALLYHMGFRGRVVRSTLADANETRDWRIYADLAHGLIKRARRIYAGEDLGLELDQNWRRLYRLHQAGAFFVIRAKDNLCFTRHTSAAVDPLSGVRSDQTGQLALAAAFAAFPAKLRKVRFWHA